jgi:hypothetical protein
VISWSLPVSRARSLRLSRCAAALGLLAALGCVDHNGGGKTLYVYDNSTSTVDVWADVSKLTAAASAGSTVPSPDRTITSSLLSGIRLAWGGLAVDSVSDRLYLVSESGNVYVITKASTQNGTLSSNTTTDIYNFSLGNTSEQFSSGAFGQATVDPTTNLLYVMENTLDGRQSRVWKVANASNQYVTVTPATSYTIGVSNDTYGAGVAAQTGGELFGLWGNGGTIYGGTGGTTQYTGARIRQSSGQVFSDPPYGVSGVVGNIIIGPDTQLTASFIYGSLAYDAQNSRLYVLAAGTSPVLAFNKSQFTTQPFDQVPAATLAAGNLSSLRILSHPNNSDWLLGAYITDTPTTTGTGTGGTDLLVWDAPYTGAAPVEVTLPGSLEVRGMAIGGGD